MAIDAACYIKHWGKTSPMIIGWHRHMVAKQTFQAVENVIWEMLWRWLVRRHKGKKNLYWAKSKYFIRHQGKDWTFFALNKEGDQETIYKASGIAIQCHPKIKVKANPYCKSWELYFENRNDEVMLNKLAGKRMMRYLYERQNGYCLVCNRKITSITRATIRTVFSPSIKEEARQQKTWCYCNLFATFKYTRIKARMLR